MPAVMIGTNRQCRIELGQSGCVRNAPVPLEGLGREADQALKGRGSIE